MNKVLLTGNLTKEIELKQTNSGTNVVSSTVAVSRNRKDADGNYGTDFINFVAWGAQAEYLANYGQKGDRIEICGRWQTRQYDDKNGQKVTVNEVQVESLSVFSRKTKSQNELKEVETDDLPF